MWKPEEAGKQVSSEKRDTVGLRSTSVTSSGFEKWRVGGRKWIINWKMIWK